MLCAYHAYLSTAFPMYQHHMRHAPTPNAAVTLTGEREKRATTLRLWRPLAPGCGPRVSGRRPHTEPTPKLIVRTGFGRDTDAVSGFSKTASVFSTDAANVVG
jgi:hypothetical protein